MQECRHRGSTCAFQFCDNRYRAGISTSPRTRQQRPPRPLWQIVYVSTFDLRYFNFRIYDPRTTYPPCRLSVPLPLENVDVVSLSYFSRVIFFFLAERRALHGGWYLFVTSTLCCWFGPLICASVFCGLWRTGWCLNGSRGSPRAALPVSSVLSLGVRRPASGVRRFYPPTSADAISTP